MAHSDDNLSYEIDGKVAVLTLDDGKANALSHELIASIESALDRAATEARSVVIAGRPGRFSAGFDLSTMTESPESARSLVAAGARMLVKIYTHPQPVVAACTGHALAAGALLLLSADRRMGAEGAFKIGLNEVSIGLRLPAFAIEFARERLSKRHFTAATVNARIYDPAGAREAGYLDDVVPEGELLERALAEATGAAELPSGALAMTKELSRRAFADHVLRSLDADLADLGVPSAAGK